MINFGGQLAPFIGHVRCIRFVRLVQRQQIGLNMFWQAIVMSAALEAVSFPEESTITHNSTNGSMSALSTPRSRRPQNMVICMWVDKWTAISHQYRSQIMPHSR